MLANLEDGLLAAGLGMENALCMDGYGSGEKLQHAGAGQAFMDGMHPGNAQVRPLAAPETDVDAPRLDLPFAR